MSRSLVVLKPGEKVTYECPPGCRAYGVLVNHSFTNAIIHFKSPVGHTTFDMRFQPQPFDWIASVAPILDPVGGGTIEVSIVDRPPASGNFHCMHGTGTVRDGPMAELGELILVSTDWKEVIPVVEKQAAETLRIEDFSWASTHYHWAASHNQSD